MAFEQLDIRGDILSFDRLKFYIKYEFEGSTHRYHPDIHVIYADGSQEIIEVKMLWQINDPRNQAKFTAAREYCQERGWKFSVWTEKELCMKIRGNQSSSYE